MNIQSKFGTSALRAAAPRAPPAPAQWHFWSAIALMAWAALLLVLGVRVSARLLLFLGLMATPGIIGALWRPTTQEYFALLALWAIAALFAVCAAGGLSGPLAVFCLAPILASWAIGASWRQGVSLSLATALLAALAGVWRIPPPPPYEPLRSILAMVALLAVLVSAAGAIVAQERRVRARQENLDANLAALRILMRDLPELGLTLDQNGVIQEVFGQAMDILPTQAFRMGLAAAAAPEDQEAVANALRTAMDYGAAQTMFASAASPDGKVELTLRRTGPNTIAGLLRPTHRLDEYVSSRKPTAGEAGLAERLAAAETGRETAELGRVKAEAAAANRARFLANMSHELRTPLNAIMGFSDMMRARMFGELSPKYAEYVDLIHESGGHLLALINDILDVSKIEAERYALVRETFDVREALNAAMRLIRLQADEAGIRLRAVLPKEPLMVDADPRAIKQIALNLLSNALKFTPSGGFVILTAQKAGEELEIVVADTGVGIASEDLNRLGKPYEQAGDAEDRARGSGLGLSLVDAFAKLHGGHFSLESRLGEGTAVTLRMPVLINAGEPGGPKPRLTLSTKSDTDKAWTEAAAPLSPGTNGVTAS